MIKPMLAKAVGDQVPTTPGLLYEPKWDGFRCLVFRDEQVILQSRRRRTFLPVPRSRRYLPEPARRYDARRRTRHRRRQRPGVRPSEQPHRPRSEAGGWKIQELSQATPAQYVAFDVLRWRERDVSQRPFAERRQILGIDLPSGVHLTPSLTTQRSLRVVRPLRGCRARRGRVQVDGPALLPGKRTMLKVKHVRTADVVVAGWRPYKNAAPTDRRCSEPCCSVCTTRRNLAQRRRGRCVQQGEPDRSGQGTSRPRDRPRRRSPVEMGASEGQRVPGMQSRWTGKKDLGFHPLRPILVAEVKYDHMQGDRFRHVASFVRWRPDREPSSCTYEQRTTGAFRRRFGAARRGGLMADETHIEVGGRAVRVSHPDKIYFPSPATRSSMWFPTTRQSPSSCCRIF